MKRTKLGVNVDHIATLREARKTPYPDPVEAAILAESAGCDSIVVHLREDRRHVKERDVRILREVVKTRLNLEMAVTPFMINFARELRPDQATFVPERREELTTEGGLDVISNKGKVSEAAETLMNAGILVSLFIDPDTSQIKAAKEIGVNSIELHTGVYCEAKTESKRMKELQKIADCTRFAKELGLCVNAGHGLHYHNTREIAEIEDIEELNIGHSIISRSCIVGIQQAVREMIEIMHPRL